MSTSFSFSLSRQRLLWLFSGSTPGVRPPRVSHHGWNCTSCLRQVTPTLSFSSLRQITHPQVSNPEASCSHSQISSLGQVPPTLSFPVPARMLLNSFFQHCCGSEQHSIPFRSIWRALPADAPLETSPKPAGTTGIRLIPSPAGVTHPLCPGIWGLCIHSDQPWLTPAVLPFPAAFPASGCAHRAELDHTRSMGTGSCDHHECVCGSQPCPPAEAALRGCLYHPPAGFSSFD